MNLRSVSGAVQGTTEQKVSRQQAQDAAILNTIQDLGYEPRNLPKVQPGFPQVKSEIRKALRNDPLFSHASAFDKAWDRMRCSVACETPKPQEEKKAEKVLHEREQEAVILITIQDLGYDPQNLPMMPCGKKWVKSEVRKVLKGKHSLFTSTTIFNKAWSRLSTGDEIVEGVEPYVPPEERSISKAAVA